MTNTLKISIRTVLILALMAVGSWQIDNLQGNEISFGNLPLTTLAIYTVYFLIGLILGTTMSPRFSKGKNKWVYLLPVLVFVTIGLAQILYSIIPLFPLEIVMSYFSQFTFLAWALTGAFFSQLIR